jgi:hypothetical protein
MNCQTIFRLVINSPLERGAEGGVCYLINTILKNKSGVIDN